MSLRVDDVNAFYGQMHILRNVSLSVAQGELVCIFGSNGHGKSTLLKAICGLVKVSSGKVIYQGTDITNMKVHEVVKKGLVYIPEDRNLFVSMTVMDNLKLGAYLPKARQKEEESLEVVLNLFPRLGERKRQVASTLSGGELRMLAVGRGLMTGAECLLIDEPSIGLSPLLKTEMYEVIKKIKDQTRRTIMLVEQEVREAKKLTERAFLLKRGEFVYEGSVEALDDETIREAFL